MTGFFLLLAAAARGLVLAALAVLGGGHRLSGTYGCSALAAAQPTANQLGEKQCLHF